MSKLHNRMLVNRVLLAIVMGAIAYALLHQAQSIIYILLGYVCAVLVSGVGKARESEAGADDD
jgi:hypothetical protein